MFYLKKTQGDGSGADGDAARQALLHGACVCMRFGVMV
jgi:hypothetical protein